MHSDRGIPWEWTERAAAVAVDKKPCPTKSSAAIMPHIAKALRRFAGRGCSPAAWHKLSTLMLSVLAEARHPASSKQRRLHACFSQSKLCRACSFLESLLGVRAASAYPEWEAPVGPGVRAPSVCSKRVLRVCASSVYRSRMRPLGRDSCQCHSPRPLRLASSTSQCVGPHNAPNRTCRLSWNSMVA